MRALQPGQRKVMVGDPASGDVAWIPGVGAASGDTAGSGIGAIAPAGPPLPPRLAGEGQEGAGLRNLAAALRRIQNRPRPADTRTFSALP